MGWDRPLCGASLLVLVASAFQACGDDEPSGGTGGEGNAGLDAGKSPVRDAGAAHSESDASVPDPELDARTGGGNSTAYDEVNGLVFASLGDAPAGAYPDTAEGLTAPQPAPGRVRMVVAADHGELLGVRYNGYPGETLTFEAFSTAQSDFGTLQRSYTITSPRPPQLNSRDMSIIDMAYHPGRDEVVVAVRDCETGNIEYGLDEDCHFDLKLFPRTAGPQTLMETVDVHVAMTALEVDAKNDLLLIEGPNDRTSFYDRASLSGGADGVDGDAGSARVRTAVGTTGYSRGSSPVIYCD